MTVVRRLAAIPAVPRRTLLEWIETDNGDTSISTRPVCSAQAQALHARIAANPSRDGERSAEPITPPAGLSLPPLG